MGTIVPAQHKSTEIISNVWKIPFINSTVSVTKYAKVLRHKDLSKYCDLGGTDRLYGELIHVEYCRWRLSDPLPNC